MFNKTLIASLILLIVVVFSYSEARSCKRHRTLTRRSGHRSRVNDWRWANDRTTEVESNSDEILLHQYGNGPVINNGALRSWRVNDSPEWRGDDVSDDISKHSDTSDEEWALKRRRPHHRRCGCRNRCGCRR